MKIAWIRLILCPQTWFFHDGSFGKGLRAVRAQIGVVFVKKQKNLEGGRRKGWIWR